jgi:tetratricopeptide (TPR) repeat protein
LIPVCVSAEDFPVLDRQVKIRQAHLKWISKVTEVSMVAVIDYIDEISNGTGTSELSSLLEDFREKEGMIESFTTHIGLNNGIRELKQITVQFRKETKIQLTANNGKALELLNRIKTALDENSDEIDTLKDEYWQTRKELTLEIFDIRVERAQTILDKLHENEYDVSEAQAKLDEIKDMRDELEIALESRDNAEILSVNVEILNLSKELRQIVRDLQVKIPKSKIVNHWINVGDRILERTSMIISELEALGMDVSELKEIHSKAEDDWNTAKEKYDEGDIDGAIEALKQLKDDLKELKQAYLDLLSEDLPEDVAEIIELTAEAVEETVESMEESI